MNDKRKVALLRESIEGLRECLQGGHPDFFNLTIEELHLHNAKNADYSKGGDALGNFYRVSESLRAKGLDISPSQVAWIYMEKQLDSAGRMLFQGYEGSVEGFDSRMLDVSVYAKLARILRSEE